MELTTWKILGRAFHFGRHGLGMEETEVIFSSDRLFSALVQALARRSGPDKVSTWLQPFLDGSPPFVLGSAFPQVGDVRFLPAPLRRTGGHGAVKALKRVRFISESLFRRACAGEPLQDLAADAEALQGGVLLMSSKERNLLPAAVVSGREVWQVWKRPRVTIERTSNRPNLYFTGVVHFSADCGLWFGACLIDLKEETRATLAQLVDELTWSGIGGERTSGLGAFSAIDGGVLDLPQPVEGPWLSLSRYLPRVDETDLVMVREAAYALDRVGGWLDSPAATGQRRRPIHMLSEGSYFPALPRPYPGQVVDLRPVYRADPDPLGHPVYRCGIGLPVAFEGGAP